MATKAPEMLSGARGIVTSFKASENPGIVANDVVAAGNDNDVLAVDLRKACVFDALIEDYDGPRPGEHEWGAPTGREMW